MQEFIEIYKKFFTKLEDIDRNMATILCQAFDDCSGLESMFKVSIIYCLE